MSYNSLFTTLLTMTCNVSCLLSDIPIGHAVIIILDETMTLTSILNVSFIVHNCPTGQSLHIFAPVSGTSLQSGGGADVRHRPLVHRGSRLFPVTTDAGDGPRVQGALRQLATSGADFRRSQRLTSLPAVTASDVLTYGPEMVNISPPVIGVGRSYTPSLLPPPPPLLLPTKAPVQILTLLGSFLYR